jgi:hypothetical protein
MLVPEEQDLADALLEIVEKHGKFNDDNTDPTLKNLGIRPAPDAEVAGEVNTDEVQGTPDEQGLDAGGVPAAGGADVSAAPPAVPGA